jgi:hypothetical protein
MAWGKRLNDDRKTTGLAAAGGAASGDVHKASGGHIRADIHVHGDTHKTVVKSKGAIEARLHRWPTMSGVA